MDAEDLGLDHSQPSILDLDDAVDAGLDDMAARTHCILGCLCHVLVLTSDMSVMESASSTSMQTLHSWCSFHSNGM